MNLNTSDEISEFLMTLFTCLRKEENDMPGHHRFRNNTAKINVVDVAVKTVVEKIKEENMK